MHEKLFFSPDESRIKTLLGLLMMWPIGRKGLTSVIESLIAGGADSFSRATDVGPLSISELTPNVRVELTFGVGVLGYVMGREAVDRSFSFITLWYVRLRSGLNVSLKNRIKERTLIADRIVRNQDIARQPHMEVRIPPNMGPNA